MTADERARIEAIAEYLERQGMDAIRSHAEATAILEALVSVETQPSESTRVESIATVIYEEQGAGTPWGSWADASDERKVEFRERAEAVIDADPATAQLAEANAALDEMGQKHGRMADRYLTQRVQLHEAITALLHVQRWSFMNGIDLTDAGYAEWSVSIRRRPQAC